MVRKDETPVRTIIVVVVHVSVLRRVLLKTYGGTFAIFVTPRWQSTENCYFTRPFLADWVAGAFGFFSTI